MPHIHTHTRAHTRLGESHQLVFLTDLAGVLLFLFFPLPFFSQSVYQASSQAALTSLGIFPSDLELVALTMGGSHSAWAQGWPHPTIGVF